MVQPCPARIGDRLEQIETPALVVDLPAYEHNLDQHGRAGRRGRPRLSAPCQDPQVAPDRAPADRARRGRHLLPEGRRGRGHGPRRRARCPGQQPGGRRDQAGPPRRPGPPGADLGLRRRCRQPGRPERRRPGLWRHARGAGRGRGRRRALWRRSERGGRAGAADRRGAGASLRRAPGLSRPGPAHLPLRRARRGGPKRQWRKLKPRCAPWRPRASPVRR